MDIDYTFLATIILYFFVVKLFSTSKLNVVYASLLVVLGSSVLSLLIRWIILSSYNVSVFQLIGVSIITTVILQLIIAFYIFHKLQETEESYTAWLIWSILGFVSMFLIIPHVSAKLVVLF